MLIWSPPYHYQDLHQRLTLFCLLISMIQAILLIKIQDNVAIFFDIPDTVLLFWIIFLTVLTNVWDVIISTTSWSFFIVTLATSCVDVAKKHSSIHQSFWSPISHFNAHFSGCLYILLFCSSLMRLRLRLRLSVSACMFL